MPTTFRKGTALHLPITLSVVLMLFNIALMVCWIVLLAQLYWWGALTIGTVVFVLMLVGLSFYLFLTIKEIRLNRRQANFVDSVTHELKSPIATLRLYLETLQMRRALDDNQRQGFYGIMENELQRLDSLISQLLEVSRLDAIGDQSDPEDVSLGPLMRQCAQTALAHHKEVAPQAISFDIEPATIHARPMVLEMIFRNLLDNAIKYGGQPPAVDVRVQVRGRTVVTQIGDNGEGVHHEMRKKIFTMFFRGGEELERRQKGTGLGLYIVHTLVRMLKGKVSVRARENGPGSVFEVELPGRAESCDS